MKITNIRHKKLLVEAQKKLKDVLEQISSSDIPLDLLSINIQEILYSLNEITGDNVSEEIINNIFSKFCLGK